MTTTPNHALSLGSLGAARARSMRTMLLAFGLSTLLVQAETPQVTDAAEQAFRHADAELVAIAKKFAAQLTDKTAREDFNQAQAAWQKFREAEARFLADLSSQGGSAWTADFLSLRTNITIERTKQLQKRIHAK